MTVRMANAGDAQAIAVIYNHYVVNTIVTFVEEPVTGAEMARRIEDVLASSLPWLVADDDKGRVIGYAYAAKWKARAAYRYSVETTVYLADGHGEKGLGTLLYTELFRLLGNRGIHVAIGGIALPNAASIALHEKFGMRKVAHFQEVGFKFGRWLDVGYWEVTL